MGALVFCLCAKEQHGPLAQLAEQRTFNPRVAGSRPARPTRDNQRYQSPSQRYQVRKDQSAKCGPTGLFISFPTRGRGYNEITDNVNEPQPPLTAPYETASHLEAPLALPEYVMEVVL